MAEANERTPPDWWLLLRDSVLGLTDDFGRYLLLQLVWLAVWIVGLASARVHPSGNVVLLALVPASSALGRCAARSHRGLPVRLTPALAGAVHRWPAALLIAVVQALLAVVALLNLEVGLSGSSVVLVAAGVLSAWVLLVLAGTAVVIWPLLLDPERDAVATGELLRLALRVGFVRPGRVVLVVTAVTVLGMIVVQAFVAALVLPALAALIVANGILPVADGLAGRASGTAE